MRSYMFFFSIYGDHPDLHVLTHSFPTRRSSELRPEGPPPTCRTGVDRRRSYLELQHLVHHADAHREAGEAEAHQEESARIEPEIGDVAGVNQVDQNGHSEGKGAEEVGARIGFAHKGFAFPTQRQTRTQKLRK